MRHPQHAHKNSAHWHDGIVDTDWYWLILMAYIGLVGAVDCDCRSVAFSASSENGLSRSQWVVISNKAQLLFIPFFAACPGWDETARTGEANDIKDHTMYIYINMNICTRHYGYMCICITLHYTTSHYIALHCIALHCIALHVITFHCVTLHYIAVHYIACICICIAFHVITFHCVTLQYVAVHSIALHYIASHCIWYWISWYYIIYYPILLYSLLQYSSMLH